MAHHMSLSLTALCESGASVDYAHYSQSLQISAVILVSRSLSSRTAPENHFLWRFQRPVRRQCLLTVFPRSALHLRAAPPEQPSYGNGDVGMRPSEKALGVFMGGTAASPAPAALRGAWAGSASFCSIRLSVIQNMTCTSQWKPCASQQTTLSRGTTY